MPDASPGSDQPVIALDGPAAAGKSSTARAVARRLGFAHVNSGELYRAVTWWALRAGFDGNNLAIESGVRELDFEFVPAGEGFAVRVQDAEPGDALRSTSVTARVSEVSALPAVRAAVLERLRRAARRRPIVCDGRDIGTTVFPRAPLKVYLTADARERARRRLAEAGQVAGESELRRETRRIRARDEADSSRAESPLARAADAVEIDGTALTLDEVAERIARLAAVRGLAPA